MNFKKMSSEDIDTIGKVLLSLGDLTCESTFINLYIYQELYSDLFALEDGQLPINIIGDRCSLEIDTYWSFHAGEDNRALLNEKKDNITLIHVKDGIDGKPKALGEGNCDIPTVIAAAKEIGLEWIIVENDDPVPPGFEDITRSLNYLKTII